MKKAEKVLLDYAENNNDELSKQIKRYIEGYKQVVQAATKDREDEYKKDCEASDMRNKIKELERDVSKLEWDNQVLFETRERWRTIAENLSAIVFSDDE